MKKELSDVIKEHLNKNGDNNKLYFLFNKLIYMIVTNKNYPQLVKERSILKTDRIISHLTPSEKEKVSWVEDKIMLLIKKWFTYKEIKSLLINSSIDG